jgi:hypothetical protein
VKAKTVVLRLRHVQCHPRFITAFGVRSQVIGPRNGTVFSSTLRFLFGLTIVPTLFSAGLIKIDGADGGELECLADCERDA